MSDPGELLAVAEAAAREAGALLSARFGEPLRDVATKSSPTDVATEADRAAEQVIRGLLARERGADAILGEEGGAEAGETGIRWVVDPLDGTTNFVYGIPAWAVTLAAQDAGGTIAGVVLDPRRGELFSARRDGPALLDGAPLQGTSTLDDLGLALVATGFGYEASVRSRQGAVAAELLPRVRDLRRVGAAALDVAWTACGRFDAYFERGTNVWDVAAGLLVCERAGLVVRSLPAEEGLPGGQVVAPAGLVDELHALVR